MKQSFLIVALAMSLLINIDAATPPRLLDEVKNKPRMERWVDSVYQTLTLRERVGQLFMPIVEVRQSEAANRRLNLLLEESKVGGLLFHKGHPETQAQITALAQRKSKTPLLISLDGEWGLSMRLEQTTRFPRNIALGATSDEQMIYAYGREVGRQCREMGIHINFAPVMDVNSNPNNPVIGTRSYGESVAKVTTFGLAYAKGLESMGVLSVAKHFPGHGDTSEDSHKTLPTVKRNRIQLDSVELVPFKKYINARYGGVLTAHLYVPAIEPKNRPSSFSPAVVTDLLQHELGFEGLVFTDALGMKGANIKGSLSVAALKAGNDILLGSPQVKTEIDAVMEAIANGELTEAEINRKCRKILTYKYVLGANHSATNNRSTLLSRINSQEASYISSRLTASSITLLENIQSTIPLKELEKRKIASLSIGSGIQLPYPFHEALRLYDRVDGYTLTLPSTAANRNEVTSKLSSYNTLLLAIHQSKNLPLELIRQQVAARNTIVVLFISPFDLSPDILKAINGAKAIILAYENTPLAQQQAAYALFGGIEIHGKLPVDVGTWKTNDGIYTPKTRLGYTDPQQVGVSAEKLNRIDKIVEEGIRSKAMPGCQVLVAKNGWVIFNRTYGYFDYASTHPVTPDDLYDIASLTKTTGTLPALMWLYDRKDFTLNDKLGTLLPAFAQSNKKNITVREMLFHESGLKHLPLSSELVLDTENLDGKLYSGTRTLQHRIQIGARLWANSNVRLKPHLVSKQRDIQHSLFIAENMYGHHSLLDTITKQLIEMPVFAKRYLYSDANFILLKAVVEHKAKQNIDDLLRDKVYRKLGANNTFFTPLQYTSKTRIAPTENDPFFRRQLLIGSVHDPTAAIQGGVSGHAGLFSNANDLAKLCQMYLSHGSYGGEQIISKETMNMFTQTKSSRSRRGLGFDKPTMNMTNGPTSRMAPATTYGHTGFTGTCYWIDPDNQLVYIFLSNRVYPESWNNKLSQLNIRTLIQDAIYESLKGGGSDSTQNSTTKQTNAK